MLDKHAPARKTSLCGVSSYRFGRCVRTRSPMHKAMTNFEVMCALALDWPCMHYARWWMPLIIISSIFCQVRACFVCDMVAAIKIFQATMEAGYVDPQSTYTAHVSWGLNDLVSNTSKVVVLEWLPSTNTGNIDVLSLQIFGPTILRKCGAFPTSAYELVTLEFARRRCFQCPTSMCRCGRKSMWEVGTKVPLLWCDGVTWNMYIHTIGWLCVPRSLFPRNRVIFKPQYGVNRCHMTTSLVQQVEVLNNLTFMHMHQNVNEELCRILGGALY